MIQIAVHNLSISRTDKLVVWSACELEEHSTGYVAFILFFSPLPVQLLNRRFACDVINTAAQIRVDMFAMLFLCFGLTFT